MQESAVPNPPTAIPAAAPSPSVWPRFLPWIAAVALVALAIAIRIPGLRQSLWYDEIWRTHLVLNPTLAREVLLGDVHNPLYNAFMYGWIRIFGDSELSIRLPSLVCGFLAVGLFGRWVARRFGPSLGWMVAVWLLLHPFQVWHSTEAKNNSFLSLFAVASLVAYDRLATLRPRHRATILLATAAGVAAIGTSWSGLLAVATAAAAAVIAPSRDAGSEADRRAIIRRVLLALGITLLALTPLLILKAGQFSSLSRAHPRHFDWRELWLFVANYLMMGNAIVPVQAYEAARAFQSPRLWFTLLQGAFIGGLLSTALARSAAVGIRRVMVWFWLPLTITFLVSFAIHVLFAPRRFYVYQERNLLWLLYPFALVVLWSAWKLRPRLLRWGLILVLFALPIAGQTLIMTTNRGAWTIYKPNPDWRSAAAMIREISRSLDHPAITIEYATTPCDPISYYLPEVRRVISPEGSDLRATAAAALSAPPARGHAFILSQHDWWPLDEEWVRSGDYYLAEVQRFQGLTVFHVYLRPHEP